MRILELFAGYGSQALALENLGIEFTSDISEIDKYAIEAYNQLHDKTHNWGDITKIDEKELPYYDLITYSSPCQDFSVAGLGKGGDKDSGTRSSLLWECERIIKAVKPKYLLMENVKNLVGKKHKHNFDEWLRVLESLGYQNYWKVLNAKDYGVPQNRERVFVVSILGGGQYLFPNPIKLEKRLKDVLESNVDEKYYLSDEKVTEFLKNNNVKAEEKAGCIISEQGRKLEKHIDIANTLMARDYKGFGNQGMNGVIEPAICASRGRNPENPSDRTTGSLTEQRLELNKSGCCNTITSVQKDNWVIEPRVMQVGNIVETDSFGGNPQCGRVYSADGCSPTLNTMQGGGREPKIVTLGNYMPSGHSASKIVDSDGITPTVMENHGTVTATVQNYRIRKLTPRECWRLMGVKDEQFDKLHDISNTQLYKMAGNSIVVDVLMAIFKNLLITDKETTGQLQLF
jgi:DNA (cytosine-5)-methyltransferase 1